LIPHACVGALAEGELIAHLLRRGILSRPGPSQPLVQQFARCVVKPPQCARRVPRKQLFRILMARGDGATVTAFVLVFNVSLEPTEVGT
jgi:hypothetical protein